eukprot:6469813-Amphidinium_carterae.1
MASQRTASCQSGLQRRPAQACKGLDGGQPWCSTAFLQTFRVCWGFKSLEARGKIEKSIILAPHVHLSSNIGHIETRLLVLASRLCHYQFKRYVQGNNNDSETQSHTQKKTGNFLFKSSMIYAPWLMICTTLELHPMIYMVWASGRVVMGTGLGQPWWQTTAITAANQQQVASNSTNLQPANQQQPASSQPAANQQRANQPQQQQTSNTHTA